MRWYKLLLAPVLLGMLHTYSRGLVQFFNNVWPVMVIEAGFLFICLKLNVNSNDANKIVLEIYLGHLGNVTSKKIIISSSLNISIIFANNDTVSLSYIKRFKQDPFEGLKL